MLIKIQPDATVCRYLFTAKSLYMFRVSQHPSSGVLTGTEVYRRLRLQLLAIFRLSSTELKVLLYILRAHVMERSLHPGFVA